MAQQTEETELAVSVIYTIGYEGTDIERFIQTLSLVGIEALADVRAVTVSRKKGFSKTKLAERLISAGIQYHHFGQLGDPKPGREAARAGDFQKFKRIYGAHFKTEAAQTDLAELKILVARKPTVLLCYEFDPKTCHRAIVANAIQADLGFTIQNLFADEPDRYVRNAEKLPRYYPSQSLTAAE